nr:hypothetical protein [Acidisoma sp. L85]
MWQAQRCLLDDIQEVTQDRDIEAAFLRRGPTLDVGAKHDMGHVADAAQAFPNLLGVHKIDRDSLNIRDWGLFASR